MVYLDQYILIDFPKNKVIWYEPFKRRVKQFG